MPDEEKNAPIDFNAVLLDVYGREMTEAAPTPEQMKELRVLDATLKNVRTPHDELTAAQARMVEIETEILEPKVRLGMVCVNALGGKAKADEHDAHQISNRTRYSLKIIGTYDIDTHEGEYATVQFADKKRDFISGLVLETYRGNPVLIARANALLHGRDQSDMGPDDE